MYRAAMAEQKRASDEANANALTKIGHWPVVSDGWDKLSSLYCRTKGSNRLVNFTFGTAEAGLKAAVNLATPVATTVLGKPMHAINEMTCRQLDKLERSYPIVTKPTNQVVDETKKKFEPIVTQLQRVHDKVHGAKDYAVNTGWEGERMVHDRMLQFINVLEFYVDKYLPHTEGETELKDSEQRVLTVRVRALGGKTKRRLSHATLQQLQHVKTRSQEVVHSMEKVDLIEYARQYIDGAKVKAGEVQQYVANTWAHPPTIRQGVSEVREMSRRGAVVASKCARQTWNTGVHYADNTVAFLSMNKLTVTGLANLAVNVTYATLDTVRVYADAAKDKALSLVGQKPAAGDQKTRGHGQGSSSGQSSATDGSDLQHDRQEAEHDKDN